MRACSQSNPRACIVRAAIHRRQSASDMLRVAYCESTWNPYAFNGAHAGLFQFRTAYPSTWATTPYARRSPYSAKWNALAAAWMWHVGRRAEWQCR